jgi:capsular polysaccharide transport system permease protein
MLVASAYWGLVASKQYSTVTKFALRSGESSILDSFGGFGGLPSSQQAQDSQILVNYIQSRAMVEALEREVDLKAIFSRSDADYFSRLPADEPIENIEKYWRKRVDVGIESFSGIIMVNLRAFSPQESLLLSRKVIELSEKLVNDISTRSRRDTLAQSQVELTRAENRLKQATTAMRDARNAEGVVDAGASAEAINKLITMLRLQLSHAESDLASQGEAAAANSPQARVLHEQIASLKQQIADYSSKIAGGGAEENMAGRIGALSGFQVDLDLARQQYAMAAVTYENARIDLETQHAYLVPFLQPTLAEKSIYPRRWWEWSIIVLPSLLIWSMLVGVAFMVRDHMAK